MTTVLLFVGFAVILVLSMPIATALLGGSLLAMLSSGTDMQVAVQRLFGAVDSFTLAAIPFFLLAGALMSSSGISRRLTKFANALLGWVPGGLAVVSVFTCMLFGCLCGSPTATVAAIGALMVPAMEEGGYSRKFTLPLLASAGMLGTIIPPSTMMITFSSAMPAASVGKLFMGGILPGCLLGGLMIAYCIYFGIKEKIPRQKFSVKVLLRSTWEAVGALLMPIIIVGGIYSGVFTPTESAAVACAYGLILGIFIYREIKLKDVMSIIKNAANTSGMLMFIVASAGVFGLVMTHQQVPARAAEFILQFASNKYVFLLLVNILLLIVGCFLESTAATLIIVPILAPVATSFGIDPVHFGIVVVLNLCVGLITPPMGVNLFVAAGIKNEKIETVVNKYLVVLFVLCLINLFIITYVPGISLFLPNTMSG